MTENAENKVLEILRRILGDLTELKSGQRDIQYRLTLVETHPGRRGAKPGQSQCR